MNSTPPSSLVETPAMTDTTASALRHPPIWEDRDDTVRLSSLGTMLYIVALLLAFPLYVAVVISIHLLYPGQGLVTAHIDLIDSAVTCMVVPLAVMLAGWMLCWLNGEPEGLGFCFDAQQQRFTFTQQRPARAPTAGSVPYSNILGVAPYKMTAFSAISHIVVCFDDADGKRVWLRFWVHIQDKDMAFHTAWLRESLGDKVDDVCDLDK
ncbi:hypothetical protein IFR09_23455 [Pseudomonas syringae]|nr:hypothetical protein [Pseudomonas syringae]MBD8792899.1 hypothetical protein [Pseudomonas syringae]MBD8803480.1 hypothetical protein [Pseudomonas syringae]MBD8814119.1 hypothetical protein [Pseudomonas syringae]